MLDFADNEFRYKMDFGMKIEQAKADEYLLLNSCGKNVQTEP